MAASPHQLGLWVAQTPWTSLQDRTTAIAVGVANGADVAKPGGIWGTGGGSDGPSQAQAAYAAYKAGGWNAFPAYRSGRYRLFIPIAAEAAAVAAVQTGSVVPDIVSSPIEDTVAAFGGLASLGTYLISPAIWERAAKVVLGGALIAIGIMLWTKQNAVDPLVSKLTELDDMILASAIAARPNIAPLYGKAPPGRSKP